VASFEVRESRRVVKKAKATIDIAIVALGGFLDNQKYDRMTAFLKFCSEVNVVEKGTTHVRHPISEETDFHYS